MKRLELTIFLIALLVCLPVLADTHIDADKVLTEQCSACHNLTGPAPETLQALWVRKGPDLFYAGNKYKREWLIKWLQAPQRIRPAGMYYGDHIKTTADGDVVDKATLKPHPVLGHEEAEAITKKLMTLQARSDLITAGDYKPGKISLSMGEMMFDKFRGCLACHQIEPGYGGASGPEVYTAAKRLQEDYMVSYMRDPQAWDPKIFMPNKHLKEQDLQKFVHYFEALSEVKF